MLCQFFFVLWATLQYPSPSIFALADSHVVVEQVLWEGTRIMDFNITPATNYSNWLNINDINRFYTDFDPNVTVPLTIILQGYVNEPCPASVCVLPGWRALQEYNP